MVRHPSARMRPHQRVPWQWSGQRALWETSASRCQGRANGCSQKKYRQPSHNATPERGCDAVEWPGSVGRGRVGTTVASAAAAAALGSGTSAASHQGEARRNRQCCCLLRPHLATKMTEHLTRARLRTGDSTRTARNCMRTMWAASPKGHSQRDPRSRGLSSTRQCTTVSASGAAEAAGSGR